MCVPQVKPKIAVAQLGARRHYAIPAMLQGAGLLAAFYTDVCAEAGWAKLAAGLLPAGLRPAGLRRLLARRPEGVPRQKIHCASAFGIVRVLRRGGGRTHGQVVRAQTNANEQFCRRLVKHGFGDADVIYAFNGAALELFQYAKSKGMRTILEQTAAPWAYDEQILADERRRWPGWEAGDVSPDDWGPMSRREVAEWGLADLILCGSQYVVDAVGVELGPVDRCVVVPYGLDASRIRTTASSPAVGRARILYAGTVQLRKGVQYLIEAAKLIQDLDVEIRVVGPIAVSERAVAELERHVTLVGSLPRSDMQREYEAADVFVLPTLSEGSANVCYEALAAGLPVVTTPNAGSVVRDGQEGFLVPIRDAQAIAERIRRLVEDRPMRQEMSHRALNRARQFTWEHYGRRLVAAILQESTADSQSPDAH
jgi:glycosyltransferase involved in cell wall biosynthesis